MSKVKMCKYCKENKNREVYFSTLDDDVYICPKCNHELIDTVIDEEDHWVLFNISDDITFLESMISLKESDPIEYQLKLSQFKTQLEQQKQDSSSTKIKCPTCSSTNIEKIGGLERVGSVAMWGLFSKKINKSFKCKDCGYTW